MCVISQDHYYKPFSEQLTDKNGVVNFDLPEAIDFNRLLKDMRLLKNGKTVELVEYTFNNTNKFPEKLTFIPTPILIIEGLFIMCDPTLYGMLDLKLFIEAKEELKLERRLKRDVYERAMTHGQILYQWNEHVKPSFDRYLLPVKEEVDMIIVNNQHRETKHQILAAYLKNFIL